MGALKNPMGRLPGSERSAGRVREERPKLPKSERLRALLPDIKALVAPRKGILAFGFVLMAINRVSGLVLPASTKFLIDDVIGKRRTDMLLPLLGAVIAATLVQGVTSFSLTQVLSKAAQRLIAELRRKVQAHIGRLPVTFYDANKTGALVSRIMSDVEGVRNLIGTGLVEFAGGLLTAAIALVVLFKISTTMTLLAFTFLVGFGLVLNRAFGTIRPIFRERGKINAEVTGRLMESLGGVRVVKGYHAEAREEGVFAKGVERLLLNVLKTLTATSVMSLSSTVLLGVVGAVVMFVGTRQILAGTLTLGGFLHVAVPQVPLNAPLVSRGHRNAAHGGARRPGEDPRDPPRAAGRCRSEADRIAAHDPGRSRLCGRELLLRGGEGSPARGLLQLLLGLSPRWWPVGLGQDHDHRPRRGVPRADVRRGAGGRRGPLDRPARLLSPALGVVLQDTFLFDGTIRENVAFSRPEASEDDILRACRIARVDEFAEGFEKKYDTIVGERGVKLSGGSASASRSRAPSSPTRASSSSTRPRPASTRSRRRSSRKGCRT